MRVKEEDSSLLNRGEGSDGDAGRRAGGGQKTRARETSEEGEGPTAAEETQSGYHVVWR